MPDSSYMAYDPDSQEWYSLTRTTPVVAAPPDTRRVSMSLPDGTQATLPASGLRRHRADGEGGTYRR